MVNVHSTWAADRNGNNRLFCVTLRCECDTTLRCEFDCSFGATPYQIARSGLAAAHFLDFGDHAMIHFLRLTGNAVCLKSLVTPMYTVPQKYRLAFDSTRGVMREARGHNSRGGESLWWR